MRFLYFEKAIKSISHDSHFKSFDWLSFQENQRKEFYKK